MTTLTIYALAHDSNSTEDVYISLHDKVKLYIKLIDDTGKTLVQRSVSNFKQAITALQCYNITYIILFQSQLYYCRVGHEHEIKIHIWIKSHNS